MVKVKERNPQVQKPLKFTLDLGVAYEDDFLVVSDFVEYLQRNFKVNGHKGQLGEEVTIEAKGKNVYFTSTRRFPKRYIKYLTKKYLKKYQILEYLRILATDKKTYTIKLLSKSNEEAEEEN